jgi:hypothetical protein
MLPVQVLPVASEERQSNGMPAWRSDSNARIRERELNVTDASDLQEEKQESQITSSDPGR